MGSLSHYRALGHEPEPVPSTGWSLGLAGVVLLAVAGVDLATGTEINLFALYFVPVAIVSWQLGRRPGIAAAAVCAVVWLVADLAGARREAGFGLAAVNALVEAAAFATVAWLVSGNRAALQRERALARRDPLTRLDNGLAFRDRAGHELARSRRTGRPLVLAYLDLDGFKAVNDARGHAAGDDVLRTVAGEIRRRCRGTDTAARLAGDEFALLLPDTDAAGARTVLEELRSAVAGAMKVRGHPVTASVGAICFARPPLAVEALLQSADALMYEAKRAGKDRVVVREAAASTPAPVPGAA